MAGSGLPMPESFVAMLVVLPLLLGVGGVVVLVEMERRVKIEFLEVEMEVEREEGRDMLSGRVSS